jgi:cytochrome b561
VDNLTQTAPIQPGMGDRYSRPAIILHWLIAAGIVANILLIWSTNLVSDEAERPLIDTHKSIGITVLGLAILRLLWRIGHKPPPLPPYTVWERQLSRAVHWSLYALMFIMPLSGWAHDSAWKAAAQHPLKLFFVIPWFRWGAIQNLDPATKESLHSLFGAIHTSFSYVLYALFVVHVAGALKHQFIDRQPSLERMLP